MDAYIVKHKSDMVRMASRSGGMFTAISDYILDNKGIVYGAKLNESLDVIHERAETKEQRDEFRGSKYVRSHLKGCIERIKQDLIDGKTVLFSGTPCQVAAVKKVCQVSTTGKLLCVDIVCHGTPRHEAWRKCRDYMCKRYHGTVQAINFRNKNKFGWSSHVETWTINGKQHDCREYTDLFYEHLLFGKGCFICKYKSLDRVGDITLADAWGGLNKNRVFDTNKGVSLVLVNSSEGKEIFEKVQSDIEYVPCNIAHYMQPPLEKNFEIPKNYDQFWMDMDNMDWRQLYRKYSKTSWYRRIIRKIRYVLK